MVGRTLSMRRSRTVQHRLPGVRLGPVGRVVSDLGRRLRVRREDRASRSELPVVVELLRVAIESGCTPFGAVVAVAPWAPARAAAACTRVVDRCELGLSFADSIAVMRDEWPASSALTDALAGSDDLGVPTAAALARLADAGRAELRRACETRARAVPVRLLFPLVLLVLPAFGLLTVVPALLGGFARL